MAFELALSSENITFTTFAFGVCTCEIMSLAALSRVCAVNPNWTVDSNDYVFAYVWSQMLVVACKVGLNPRPIERVKPLFDLVKRPVVSLI